MVAVERVTVQTKLPYEVVIGSNILKRCGKEIGALSEQNYQTVVLISDDNVLPLYGEIVTKSLEQAGYQVRSFCVANGEASKSIEQTMAIISFLCDNYVTRKDLLVALGGGVVGDLVGFVASIYNRGIDFVQIPTTFLAAIDSSVGGKTAINIPHGKNLVGCFWQPRLVICDIDTMDTLPKERFADGVAEAIKYGCIWDRELFEEIADGHLQDNLASIIGRCVHIKAEVVRQDEREGGLRQILNFGHTLGHAIEKQSQLAIPHGQAVAIGMHYITKASEARGISPAGTATLLRSVLERYNLPIACQYPINQLCELSLSDKKRQGNCLSLIVLKEIGRCMIHPVETQQLLAFMKE